jgi:hypothetical protein
VIEYFIEVLRVLPFTLLYGAFLFSMFLLIVWLACLVSGDPLNLEDLKRLLRYSGRPQHGPAPRPRRAQRQPQNPGHGPHPMWDRWLDR